jgi:hypothetical protein
MKTHLNEMNEFGEFDMDWTFTRCPLHPFNRARRPTAVR